MKNIRDYFTEAEQSLAEKAVSQQQQKFMGMVHAMQKGEKIKGASPELKKVARTMKKSDAKDFARTKHKGLPKKVGESEVNEVSLGDYYDKALKSKWGSTMASIAAKSPEEQKAAHRTFFAREKGIERAKGRMAKAAAAERERAGAEQTASDRANVEQLKAQLSKLQSQFDPNFEYSDDHSFWTKQREIQGQIQSLKKRLAAIGESTMKKGSALLQGVREVMEARLIDESGETFEHILNRFKNEVKRFEDGDELDSDLYEALFDYYANLGEIPYGTMKARTGDPYEWITQRLVQDLGLKETVTSPMDEIADQVISDAVDPVEIPAFKRKHNARLGNFPEPKIDAPTSFKIRPETIPAAQRKASGKDFPATLDQVHDTSDKISSLDTLRKMAGLPPRV